MKKQTWRKRILPIILSMVLMIGIFPASAALQEIQDEVAALIVSEDVSKREISSKHFLCEDGSYLVAAFSSPVHYDDNGVLKDIDNRLMLNSSAKSASGKATYTPKASGLSVSIPQDFSNGQQFIVRNKGYTFGFGVKANDQTVIARSAATVIDVDKTPSAIALQQDNAQSNTLKTQGKLTKSEAIKEQNAEKMVVDNLSSAIVYKEIFPAADLEYIVEPERVKENIVVAAPQAEYIYRFDVSMDGLVSAPQEDGSIWLAAANNPEEIVFVLQAPYMYDADGETSLNVKMTLKNGVLTVIADAAWLNDEERAFPAIIDPTIIVNTKSTDIINDAYISSLFPKSRNNNSLRLFTGKTLLGERNRTYIKFNLPAIPAGSTIDYAQFELKSSTNANTVLNVRDLYPSSAGTLNIDSVCWNSQPINTAANSANTLPLVDSRATASGSTFYRFVITSALQRWYSGTRNNGLVITTTNENNISQPSMYSSRSTLSSDRPVLWFGYTFSEIQFPNVSADRYSFNNSLGNFTNIDIKDYYMSTCDLLTLEWNVLTTIPLYATVVMPLILSQRYQDFGGSCYGMAATAILDKQGLLPMKARYGKTQLKQIPRPITNLDLLSAINYYQATQQIEKFDGLLGGIIDQNVMKMPDKANNPDAFKRVAKQIVDDARSGKEQLFSYYFPYNGGTAGHAIVMNPGVVNVTGGYNLTAYDNRFPYDTVNKTNKNITVFISSNYLTVRVLNDVENRIEEATMIMSMSNLSGFNRYKLFGSGSSSSSSSSSSISSSVNSRSTNTPGIEIDNDLKGKTLIEFAMRGKITVENAEGKTLVYDSADGSISGTMEHFGYYPVMNDSSSTMTFVVPDSESFTFTSSVPGIDAGVMNTEEFARAESDSASKVIVKSGETIKIIGKEEFGYRIAQSSTAAKGIDVSHGMVIIEGTATDSTSLTLSDNGVQADGVGAGAELSVVDINTLETSESTISIGRNSVQISGTPDNVNIRANTP